jgi:hypothetical protein
MHVLLILSCEMRKYRCIEKFQTPTYHAQGGLKLTDDLLQQIKLDIYEKSTLGQKQVTFLAMKRNNYDSLFHLKEMQMFISV